MMQNIPVTCRQFYRKTLAVLPFCILFLGNMSYAAPFKLEFPVGCIHGQTCWILNYMDADVEQGAAADFTCGPRTEDGAEGIDIAVRDLATAGNGVAVLAAADGTVRDITDGITDLMPSSDNLPQMLDTPCGNMVVIDHGKGWETRYCHLRENSLQVAPGQRVQAGQILGAVGLSGLTTWPKLNFTVSRWDTLYDPYTGRTPLEGCGLSTAKTLWKYPEDVPYRAFAIYNLGFDITAPQENSVDMGKTPVSVLPSDAPSLSFWATVFDARAGDIVDMAVTDPRGNDIMKINATLQDDQKKRLLSMTKPREGLWPRGMYNGTIRVTRGTGPEKQTSEWAARVIVN